MAVVPFSGPRQARPPEADIDPSFLQMAGAMIYADRKAEQQKSETQSDDPTSPNNL